MTNHDLFDNPMVNAARASMTPEQLAQYQREGMYMFEMMDVTRDPLDDFVQQIEELLQGGLHPSYLNDSEKLAMENVYGKKWYKKYGWNSLEM